VSSVYGLGSGFRVWGSGFRVKVFCSEFSGSWTLLRGQPFFSCHLDRHTRPPCMGAKILLQRSCVKHEIADRGSVYVSSFTPWVCGWWLVVGGVWFLV